MEKIEILTKQLEIMEECLQAIINNEEEPVQLAIRAIDACASVGIE
jgi:hypothetical protein